MRGDLLGKMRVSFCKACKRILFKGLKEHSLGLLAIKDDETQPESKPRDACIGSFGLRIVPDLPRSDGLLRLSKAII